MENCEGKTLRQFLLEQKNLLKEDFILRLFFQMINILKSCHDHKIIHRNIKPENILLSQNGQIKFLNFGIDKILKEDINVASINNKAQNYISPEVIQGKQFSFASDIWSLGIIAYEMMTLKYPFQSENPIELSKKICNDEIEFSMNYSNEFESIIRSMLLKDSFLRISLKRILKHQFLWNFSSNQYQNLKENIDILKRELLKQKEIHHQLEEHNHQINQLNKELIEKNKILLAELHLSKNLNELNQTKNLKIKEHEDSIQFLQPESQKIKESEERTHLLQTENQQNTNAEQQDSSLQSEKHVKFLLSQVEGQKIMVKFPQANNQKMIEFKKKMQSHPVEKQVSITNETLRRSPRLTQRKNETQKQSSELKNQEIKTKKFINEQPQTRKQINPRQEQNQEREQLHQKENLNLRHNRENKQKEEQIQVFQNKDQISEQIILPNQDLRQNKTTNQKFQKDSEHQIQNEKSHFIQRSKIRN
jgi:NIMA (never in mitosis gene a)-related kinase